MNDTADVALGAAALGYAGAVAFGTIVAVRENVPGRPFRIRIPLSVRTGVLVGWGAGIAAPWPMPVAAVVAAWRAKRGQRSDGPARVCVALGVANVMGFLIEPNTFHPASWTPWTRAAIVLNMLASGVMVAAGLRAAGASPRAKARFTSHPALRRYPVQGGAEVARARVAWSQNPSMPSTLHEERRA